MIPHLHLLSERRLYRLFTGAMSPAARRRVMADAECCQRCRTLLRRYYHLEGALATVEAVSSPVAVDRMASAVLAAVTVSPAVDRSRYRRPITAAASIASLLAALWLFVPSGERTHRLPMPTPFPRDAAELVSRGGEAGNSDVGIRAFAISGRHAAVGERSTLALDDILSFTYTRATSNPGYIMIFGIQEAGDIIWYYPDYGETGSVAIDGDRIDEPLGDGFDLSVHHRTGALLIVALFSDAPVAVSAVETAATQATAEGQGLEAAARYAWSSLGKGVSVHSLLLEVEADDE